MIEDEVFARHVVKTECLADIADGDARAALNAIELAVEPQNKYVTDCRFAAN